MRKTLIGLAMLVVAAGLTTGAQGPVPIQKDAKTTVAEAAQRDLDNLQAQLVKVRQEYRAANEHNRMLDNRRAVLTAEHQVRVATEEADYRVKMAHLDRERLEAGQTMAKIEAQLAQLTAEVNQQVNPGGRGGKAGGGRGKAPDLLEMIKGGEPGGRARGPGPAAADDKLEAIMQKLAEMEARLKRLEDRRQDKNR